MPATDESQPVTTADGAGPRDPATTTPVRRPGSIRRTSAIDMLRPDGWTGDLLLVGRARDLMTTEEGATVLENAAPDHRDACTPLYLLLDDLPVASLISGYAMQRSGEIPRMPAASYTYNVDECAGWRAGGTLMVVLSEKGAVPMTIGSDAPDLEPADDPLAWHEHDALPPGAMRRRRRLDVHRGEALHIDAMFRDSYMELDGVESIVHEYSFTGSVDPTTLQVLDAHARPRVLPYTECPDAAASATRLGGMTIDEPRHRVRRELTGITTCTHLNDLLRSLTDVRALAAAAY